MGNLAPLMHAPAQDEIIKNTFANYAFAHYEMAAYKSLITTSEQVGDTGAIASLEQSLSEEVSMARLIETQLAPTTRRYMQLSAAGQTAGR